MIRHSPELRRELTEALIGHLHIRFLERWERAVGRPHTFVDLLSEERHFRHLEEIASDAMDFIYGEVVDPAPPSDGDDSGESPPLPAPQG